MTFHDETHVPIINLTGTAPVSFLQDFCKISVAECEEML